MANYKEHNGRTGLWAINEPFEGKVKKTELELQHAAQCSPKDVCDCASTADGNTSGASFTTNNNSVVCLPLVSEGLKLVWTQADQTRDLDGISELVQAFNLFPYPSSREVNTLARICALPLDKVKVWFMVQRIKYGISWSSEEIEETRRKLSVPELSGDCNESTEERKMTSKSSSCVELAIKDDGSDVEADLSSIAPQKTTPKCESPDSYKLTKPTAPCFSTTLPPPQDLCFYRPPVDIPASSAADVSIDLSKSSSQQQRHGRYKKSKAQLAALRNSFLKENWPAEAELRRLQEETGLSRNDIRKWFSDSRYQLRVGRGALAAAQSYTPHTGSGGKHDLPIQPVSLITQQTRQLSGVKGYEVARSNGIKQSHFFQTFLSNSLEALDERALGGEEDEDDAIEVISGDGDTSKDENDCEEQPLQLTKTCNIQPDVPQQLSSIIKSTPCSSPSGSPPPPASPNKQLSNGLSTSKKSTHTAKASSSQTPVSTSGASSSTSSALTPSGRPRKTKEQLGLLKQYFLRCQWPKSEEYTELVKITGLPRADVIQWFGDTRYAVKNGQLRWVKGVRDQFLAELAAQHSSNGLTNGSGTGSTTLGGGSRKRKSQANATRSDSPDIQPLVSYYHTTGLLQEKDLDSLCKKSRMSYQQVRNWFAAQEIEVADQKSNAMN
ncbi:homeobox and leucine zipper encoding a [Thalassophryne amazonica]|uniref:homeobox and leucine zipper encoding a n=1 Tax=Thalassophryne amazonica TaxID=390379 RepID=UPI0014711216|nr:homeobox and leucine zipper encoding a [Thalassophryne amazonica]XP_034038360.1 homeobox and leucine zipper encoding a [Thalassophryne amazonica]